MCHDVTARVVGVYEVMLFTFGSLESADVGSVAFVMCSSCELESSG